MAKTTLSGPMIVYGQQALVDGIPSDYNPDVAPSVFWGGVGILDLRSGYHPGGNDTDPMYAFSQGGSIPVINQVPSALSATNIAAAQVPVDATALTLVSSSGSGITVSSSALNVITGETVTGLLAIDSAVSFLTFGSNATPKFFNPATAISRNLRFTSVGDDSGATATIVGYDIYGVAMSETVTLANAGVASGAKAFKYIESITPNGTLSGSNLSVGTGDVFGLPIRADYFGDARILWNSTVITASTGFTAAVTSTATDTTGDVRGTYGVQSASDGTKRLQVFSTIQPANIGTSTGIFGVTQA